MMSDNILDEIKKNQETIISSLNELKNIIKRQEKSENKNEYPITLKVQEIADILRINQTKAYELTHREDFPSLKLGQRFIVNRDKFFDWLDKGSEKWIE